MPSSARLAFSARRTATSASRSSVATRAAYASGVSPCMAPALRASVKRLSAAAASSTTQLRQVAQPFRAPPLLRIGARAFVAFVGEAELGFGIAQAPLQAFHHCVEDALA